MRLNVADVRSSRAEQLNDFTFEGARNVEVRVVVECVEEMLIRKSRVVHPLAQVSSFLVIEREFDEGARSNDVGRPFVDIEVVRNGRLERIRSPVLRAPTVLHPINIATAMT